MVSFLPQGPYSYNESPYSPAMETIDQPAKALRHGLLQDSVENNDPASKTPGIDSSFREELAKSGRSSGSSSLWRI